ncbi:G-type lectin S-receptor-like serine/threonine-protein kinase At2g19130 [Fagus crenata]
MAIPQRCEILGFCGDSSICNQQKVPICDCLNGFKPMYPKDWNLYYYSKGCMRRKPLQCSQGGIDMFLTIPNMRFPEASNHPTVKNIEECKLICLSDCFCNAYTYYKGCGIYWGPLMNLQQLSSDNEFGRDFHVNISTSELLVESRNKISKKAALIVGVPSVLIFLIGIVLAIIWRAHSIGALEEVEFSLILFKYQDIRKATKNFSQKLGDVSGRRNINMLDDEICNYFPARVAIAMNKGEDLLTLLDYKLEGNANVEELTNACKVACWCIQDDPKDRPTMGQVVKILEGIMQLCGMLGLVVKTIIDSSTLSKIKPLGV